MKKDVTIELINNFSKTYNKDKNNKILEKEITEKGINIFLFNKNVIKQNKRKFNIELPNIKRENQQESSRCWIYAGINFLKYDIANKLNCDINKIKLSYNYISFFDKLEKFNSIYEKVISEENINITNILKVGLSEWGYWIYFVELIEKYGLVPLEIMPENINSYNSDKLLDILNEKLKKDVFYFINKKEKLNYSQLYKIKEEKLFEVYEILSKILGEPNLNKFNYSYLNNQNKKVEFKKITPLDFKNKILSINLNDFVSVASFNMLNREYYKKYQNKNYQDIYNKTYPEYINLPLQEIKDLAIKQLKDGLPVRFSSEIKKDIYNKEGIMDCNINNYSKLSKIELLTRRELLDSKETRASHAMIFSGVHIENNKPIRWKVEDTRNITRNYNGPYIMNDNFFDKYVYAVYINKKYFNNIQLDVCNSKPIEVGIDDPF